MAKSLVRLGTSLKRLSSSSKYFGPVRLCHSEHETTEVATLRNNNLSEAKKLFELFRTDNNPISIVVNIEENKEKIDGRHVVTALTSMYEFYKTNNYPIGHIQDSPQFIKICNYLNKHVRNMEKPQIIQALKILNLFQVDSSTTIVQNLLQMIRVSINELHPHEIYYLAFLLKHLKPTHLGNAIFTALPEVFKARIKMKIDDTDLEELTSALQYASNYLKDQTISQFLINEIYKYEGPIDTASAIKIFRSLSKFKDTPDNYIDILYRIRDVLLKNEDKLKEIDVLIIISKICSKVSQGYNEFYDPILLDVLINKLIKKDYGFEKGIEILNKINRIKHVHLSLLKYLTTKCTKNHYILTRNKPTNMTTFLQGLANSGYKPLEWEELRKPICNSYKKFPHHVGLSYLALYMAALGSYDSNIIKEIFESDQNPDLLTSEYREVLCQLYQVVKTLYPEYTGPWPLDEIVDSFKTFKFKSESEDYPLIPALNILLGNSAYMKTNVRTYLGHHFDHLIVLQHGSPIIIEPHLRSEDSNLSCFIEDMNIPHDCERVAISLIPRESYSRNIAIPNVEVSLKQKSLEAMNFKVVHIPKDRWISMPDFELIPYLKNIIGIKNINKIELEDEDDSSKLSEANR